MTRKITLPEQGAESLFGPLDENLKLLEAQFNVQIRTNSTEMIVEGESDDVDKAERVLGQLTSMMGRTMILPAALRYQAEVASAVNATKAAGVDNHAQGELLKSLTATITRYVALRTWVFARRGRSVRAAEGRYKLTA